MLSFSPTAQIAQLPVSLRFPNTYASKVGKTSDGMYKVRAAKGIQSLWKGVGAAVQRASGWFGVAQERCAAWMVFQYFSLCVSGKCLLSEDTSCKSVVEITARLQSDSVHLCALQSLADACSGRMPALAFCSCASRTG